MLQSVNAMSLFNSASSLLPSSKQFCSQVWRNKKLCYAYISLLLIPYILFMLSVHKSNTIGHHNKKGFSLRRKMTKHKSVFAPSTPSPDTVTDLTMDTYSRNCSVRIFNNLEPDPDLPFKIYIYDLPDMFNVDLVQCINQKDIRTQCMNTDNCGFGDLTYKTNEGLFVHNTWMFSLEVIIHHKLMYSPLRTLNIDEADVFYVPFYGGLGCLCHFNGEKMSDISEKLSHFLRKQKPFVDGKPHLMAVGKIEREMSNGYCPVLKDEAIDTMTIIGIEREIMRERVEHNGKSRTFITVPYPSYGHLNSQINSDRYIKNIHNNKRPVFILLASSSRRSNIWRNLILDQIPIVTNISFMEYTKINNISTLATNVVDSIRVDTPECRGDHYKFTIEWMQRATLCVQPFGDSPTRKSTYDAIISGCVPVFFNPKGHGTVSYPFEDEGLISYDDMAIFIEEEEIANGGKLLEILDGYRKYGELIIEKRKKLRDAIQYLQYDYPITNGPHNDAMLPLLHEIKAKLKL